MQGHGVAMSLTAEQIAAYRSQGYLAVPQFFTTAEIAALRGELARLQQAGLLRNVATDGDGRTHSTTRHNLQICPISPHSELIRALPFAEAVAAAVAALLGVPFRQRLDQIFLKPARTGAGTGWHQDNDYFHELRGRDAMRGLGMWISLHDASVANGTMTVLPGVHERSLPHVRDGGSDHHVTCAAVVDERLAVPIELPAGGVLFFNYGVPHRTGPNTTDHDRAGLALHFQDAAVPIGEARHRTPLITGPGADGGVADYGQDQRGRWADLVAATSGGALYG